MRLDAKKMIALGMLNRRFSLSDLFRMGNDGFIFGAQDPNVLLMRRNLLLATATMSTQSVTTRPVAHTLSFTGTGTVTLSGASTAGPLVGTGASNRVSLAFTPTAASLTMTVTGSVTLAQLERGSLTEYQPVTDWTTEYTAAVGALVQQWQESTGVTPVMVTETACGLRMDNSRSLVRGATNLVTNGDISGGVTGWTAGASTTRADVSGVLRVTNVGAVTGYVYQALTTVADRFYEVLIDFTLGTATSAFVNIGTSIAGTQLGQVAASTSPKLRIIFKATGATSYLAFGNSAQNNAYGDFDNISIREVPGNHTLQATSAARPVVSQRVNMLTKTRGQYADAAWTKTDTTPTEGQTATDGTATASLMTEGVAGTGILQSGSVTTGAPTGVARFELKRGNTDWVRLRLLGNGAVDGGAYWVNLATGAAGSRSVINAGSGLNHTVTPLANGWHEVRLTATASGSVNWLISVCSATADASVTRVNNATYLIRDPDVRTADDAAKNIPAYQYVNTAADYQTDGFPAYDKFDGTDDSRTSATGGGSTTGFFWCGVVTVLGGAGAARDIWEDRSGATGIVVRVASTNAAGIYIGNGGSFVTAFTSADSAPVGATVVATVWYDGANAYAQINNQTPVASAAVTLSAGTTGFTEGKQNGAAAEFFNGRLYGRVMTKNYCPSASQRELIKRELARQACATHLLT